MEKNPPERSRRGFLAAAGSVLALGTAMVFVLSVWVLATGSAIGAFWFDRIDKWFFILGGILVLGAWVYKILVFKGVL